MLLALFVVDSCTIVLNFLLFSLHVTAIRRSCHLCPCMLDTMAQWWSLCMPMSIQGCAWRIECLKWLHVSGFGVIDLFKGLHVAKLN